MSMECPVNLLPEFRTALIARFQSNPKPRQHLIAIRESSSTPDPRGMVLYRREHTVLCTASHSWRHLCCVLGSVETGRRNSTKVVVELLCIKNGDADQLAVAQALFDYVIRTHRASRVEASVDGNDSARKAWWKSFAFQIVAHTAVLEVDVKRSAPPPPRPMAKIPRSAPASDQKALAWISRQRKVYIAKPEQLPGEMWPFDELPHLLAHTALRGANCLRIFSLEVSQLGKSVGSTSQSIVLSMQSGVQYQLSLNCVQSLSIASNEKRTINLLYVASQQHWMLLQPLAEQDATCTYSAAEHRQEPVCERLKRASQETVRLVRDCAAVLMKHPVTGEIVPEDASETMFAAVARTLAVLLGLTTIEEGVLYKDEPEDDAVIDDISASVYMDYAGLHMALVARVAGQLASKWLHPHTVVDVPGTGSCGLHAIRAATNSNPLWNGVRPDRSYAEDTDAIVAERNACLDWLQANLGMRLFGEDGQPGLCLSVWIPVHCGDDD